MSVNVNVFNFNSNGVQPSFFEGLNPASLRGVNDVLSDIFSNFAQLFDSVGSQFSGGNQTIAPGGCVSSPLWGDCTHPEGSLKTDGGVVTTPGGYKIEATGKFEWTITGPDDKSTRVWGDPHVAEGDGGKWDFKRDSTFVLGDGTKVNVTTAPYGNGMTVTSGLEIISGNDRVNITDIDKGKGIVGQVTQDGYAHANSFGGKDVFVMGGETDDWSFQGKEIIGSNNGGDSFKLGKDMTVNTPGINPSNNFDFAQLLHNFVNELIGGSSQNWKPNKLGTNPYYNGLSSTNNFRADNNYDRTRHQNTMRQAFKLFGEMFNVLAKLASLSDRMHTMRNRSMYA